MKSNKTSDPQPVKRTPKSSTAAKTSTAPAPKSTSHRHSKANVPATPVVEEIVIVEVAAKTPSPDDIARLAHSFWVERNFAHGFSEEDWYRAEKALAATT